MTRPWRPLRLVDWLMDATTDIPLLSRLHIRRRLTLCFILVIMLMLIGDGALLWQLLRIRAQVERLSAVDEELIEVQRVHSGLQSFYERLGASARSEGSARLLRESEELRTALLDDAERTQAVFSHLPHDVKLNETVLPTLESIERTLPSHLDAIRVLAASGQWDAVRLRLDLQVQPLESLSSDLVRNVAREVGEQRTQAALNIAHAERQMLFGMAVTGLVTLLIAAGLGVAVTRSITEPLGQLVEGSKALARGEFQHVVPVIGQDELAQLTLVFNETTRELRDLFTERKLRGEEIRKFASLVENSTDLIGIGSLQGEVLFINAAGQAIVGLSGNEQVRGTKIPDYVAEQDLDRFQAEVLPSVFKDGRWEGETLFRHFKTAAAIPMWQHVFFITDEAGCPLALATISRDITERKRAEEALRRSEGYLSEAQRLTHTGSYAWNVASGQIVYWSQEIYRLYGFDPEKGIPPFESFRQRIHADDRANAAEVLERTIREKVDHTILFRAVLPDGRLKYIHSVGHPVLDSSGNVVEVVGTNMDVTEQREPKEALETALREIKALKDRLYDENVLLREEIDKVSMFEEIVGESAALHAVLARVAKVAPTDSTVLVTGETGTGKELIARAIHKRSARAARATSADCSSSQKKPSRCT